MFFFSISSFFKNTIMFIEFGSGHRELLPAAQICSVMTSYIFSSPEFSDAACTVSNALLSLSVSHVFSRKFYLPSFRKVCEFSMHFANWLLN